MKNLIAILAIALFSFTGTANAQKYGHINAQEILLAVPGYQASSDEMERYSNQKTKAFNDLQTTIQNDFQQYMAIRETLPEAVQKSRDSDFREQEAKLQEFGVESQRRIEAKQNELMEPLLKQIQEAIKVVGREQGFAYIFDITQGGVVYFDGGIDATQLVIAQIKKATAPTMGVGTGTTPAPVGPIMRAN